MLQLSRSQWNILFAAWLGWGFNIFDSLLFNYVAANCIPTLLGLQIGSPEAKSAILFWTGILTSLLLIGWAIGGIIFGQIADRIGRLKTMLITMLLYSLGTAFCAFSPNLWFLIAFRFLASLGIGGEWASGATLVSETVPDKNRVEAGALLYTSAPMGLFLATFVNWAIAGNLMKDQPEVSWRYVFACGLIPAIASFIVRAFAKEPERWEQTSHQEAGKLVDIFTPKYRRSTISAIITATIALITWWSCNAFILVISGGIAQANAVAQGLDKTAISVVVEQAKTLAANCYNMGGLIGTLLTIPIAKTFGRKRLFSIYFLLSAISIFVTFGMNWDPLTRTYLYFFVGLTVFGIFGSFTYYLPELFPTRLRATGAGFCYNVGRIVASIGPFWVGSIAAAGGANAATSGIKALFWIGFVPLIGILLMPWVLETKNKVLED
jgi:MFS family permease